MKKIGFEALIKEINSKSLVSGDKATRIILEFESTKALEVLNGLNALHVADKTVAVAIAEIRKEKRQ
jgi:hypothetical protein